MLKLHFLLRWSPPATSKIPVRCIIKCSCNSTAHCLRYYICVCCDCCTRLCTSCESSIEMLNKNIHTTWICTIEHFQIVRQWIHGNKDETVNLRMKNDSSESINYMTSNRTTEYYFLSFSLSCVFLSLRFFFWFTVFFWLHSCWYCRNR